MQSDPTHDDESPHESASPTEPVRRTGLIPRELLDEQAVFVVRRLQREGHEAYLVGGCVRDLLAGLEPKDFDLVTDARPNRIKRLFRSARVIGRRFRLVHIHFPGNHIIETATFRGDPADEPAASSAEAPADAQGAAPEGVSGSQTDGRRGRPNWRDSAENIFGTPPEDARRRDFTINALFYDPVRDEVIDWVGGLEDMKRGIVHSIGAPSRRIKEDPVRMLRAVHFAERLDFKLEPGLEASIRAEAGRLNDASQARLYIELVKMLTRGRAHGTFRRLHELGVLSIWLPELSHFLEEPVTWPKMGGGTHEEASRGEPVDVPASHATWNLLGAADRWGLAAKKAPESLALAVLFGPWLRNAWRVHQGDRGRGHVGAFMAYIEDYFRPVAVRMSVPRWASTQMRDLLWMLDDLRMGPSPKLAQRLMRRPAFALALVYYELDLLARDGDLDALEEWRRLAEEQGVSLSLEKPQTGQARGARRGSSRRGGARRGGQRGGRSRSNRGGRSSGGSQPADPHAPEAGAWAPPPPE